MRFPHNDALTLHQVRAVRNGSRVTAGTVVCASPSPPRHPGLVPGSTPPRGKSLRSIKRRQPERDRQIGPVGIGAFDQVLLPVAPPGVDPLLAGDGGLHRVGHLEAYQNHDAVAAGEALERAITMLHDPTDEVGRDAGVNRPIEAVGEHVDARLPVSHNLHSAAPWTPEQLRRDGVGVTSGVPYLRRHPGLVPGSTLPHAESLRLIRRHPGSSVETAGGPA